MVRRGAGMIGAGAGLCAVVAVAQAEPRGRVVRVERAPAVTAPRYCSMAADAGRRVCFGRPFEGEHVAVIDTVKRTVRGDFVIESIEDDLEYMSRGLCVAAGAYAVKGRFASGAPDRTTELIGLRGLKLGKQARVLAGGVQPPSGRADERVELAVDADGDGRADVALTRYPCDPAGNPRSGSEGICYDVYVAERGRLSRTSQDVVGACP